MNLTYIYIIARGFKKGHLKYGVEGKGMGLSVLGHKTKKPLLLAGTGIRNLTVKIIKFAAILFHS